MQALSPLPLPNAFLVSDEFAPISAKFDHQDFTFDLKINHEDEDFEKEFTFACEKPQGSLATADEIFDNGRIRPIFPVFDGSLLFTAAHDGNAALKKLFVEQRRDIFPYNSELQNAPEASPFEVPRKTAALEVEGSKDMGKKSNSTGFSKLWRLRRDLKLRSNSDGSDAFVFLNPLPPSNSEKKVKNVVLKKEKPETTSPSSLSAHEKLYVMNRKRSESDKRRSFLPYKQQLGGFFANVNGFSRNLHPF